MVFHDTKKNNGYHSLFIKLFGHGVVFVFVFVTKIALLLSRRPLNAFTDVASTSSWDKLFQRLMTRCEKNWRRASQWQWFFRSFQLVTLFSDLWKNSFQWVLEKPLTNLKSSIVATFIKRPKTKLTKSIIIWQASKFREQTSESMLDSLKQFNVLDIGFQTDEQ